MKEETIEIRDALAALRRGWRWILGGAAIGATVAVVLSLVLPPRYEARSLVLVRSGGERSAISLSGLGGLGGLLPRQMQSALDTEIELITSRTGIEAVVDSLHLRAVVQRPRGVPATALFESLQLSPDIRPATYRFSREGTGYRVRGEGVNGLAAPGAAFALPGGRMVLSTGPLPDDFRIRLLDREAAVRRVSRAIEVGNPGGDVAELVYRTGDPWTAAAVPNALLAFYMHRRATSDRGVNQRRYEFLQERVDSVQAQLAIAEDERRQYQEATGRFDPALFAEADLERASRLRSELESLDMETRALGELVLAYRRGGLSPRDLAAYPTFLRNQAINDLLSRLLEAEQERIDLLERRTEVDPDVLAINQRIDQLETQLVSLSTAYLQGLSTQQTQLRMQLATYEGQLAAVPQLAQSAQRLYRDVERLTEMSVVLHAQLLEARLDAISEGGDVRQIDTAVPPIRAEFPKMWLNLLIGLFGGVLLGTVGAFGRSAVAGRIETARDAELATGLPAVLFRAGSPLLLANAPGARGVLVVPLGSAQPGTVAEHMAATASLQGKEVALIDVATELRVENSTEQGNTPGTATVPTSGASGVPLIPAAEVSREYPVYRWQRREELRYGDLRSTLTLLEERHSLVICSLPALDHPFTTALLSPDRPVVLVAGSGAVARAELSEVVESLSRAGVPTAGVVVTGTRRNGAH